MVHSPCAPAVYVTFKCTNAVAGIGSRAGQKVTGLHRICPLCTRRLAADFHCIFAAGQQLSTAHALLGSRFPLHLRCWPAALHCARAAWQQISTASALLAQQLSTARALLGSRFPLHLCCLPVALHCARAAWQQISTACALLDSRLPLHARCWPAGGGTPRWTSGPRTIIAFL